jgi:hypothetical protein
MYEIKAEAFAPAFLFDLKCPLHSGDTISVAALRVASKNYFANFLIAFTIIGSMTA